MVSKSAAGVSWFASLFVTARVTGLQVATEVPKSGHIWKPGELENFQALTMRALFPFLRPLARWQQQKLTADFDEAGILIMRWAQVQGLATMAQFLSIAIAAAILSEGLKFG